MADVHEWVLAATVRAVRRRCEGVEGAEVLERDGLVLSLTNVPDPSLNTAFVEREPADPRATLAWAEEEMAHRGHTLGIDYPVGRFPALGVAVREAGLERVISRPLMVAMLAAVPDVAIPPGVRIRPVEDRADALALARVDVAAFGTRFETAERAFATNALAECVAAFVAWEGDEPVGCAVAQEGAGATGVFGVGVVPEARRRGIGAALTVGAARAFPADRAWLVPSDLARPMYERLGFRELETWEVWVRPSPA